MFIKIGAGIIQSSPESRRAPVRGGHARRGDGHARRTDRANLRAYDASASGIAAAARMGLAGRVEVASTMPYETARASSAVN